MSFDIGFDLFHFIVYRGASKACDRWVSLIIAPIQWRESDPGHLVWGAIFVEGDFFRGFSRGDFQIIDYDTYFLLLVSILCKKLYYLTII